MNAAFLWLKTTSNILLIVSTKDQIFNSSPEQPLPFLYPAHTVRIEAGSRLRRILGKPEVWVNGKHRQAVKDSAPRLVVTARARDRVIEAVEHSDKHYVIGVRWHPEGTWRDDAYSKKLFRYFLRAAGELS
ncbi:MAG: gamma-glutamyl-gamma-aminobutyrate hydrolase family protein [Deltaproteobacteria bacterium]|nr:gamma-glutamyl-gamma-aminobutyrate hydrolase family protein [Deltaproteobacteria bacterium]